VCWISRNEEDRAADFGQLDCEGAGGCRLSYTSLSTNKDPSQCLLVEDGLEGGLELVIVGIYDGGRHVCGSKKIRGTTQEMLRVESWNEKAGCLLVSPAFCQVWP